MPSLRCISNTCLVLKWLKLKRRKMVREGGAKQPALFLYNVCCNCSAPNANLKCPCHAVYYYSSAHYLEHKHECTDRLRKGIRKKSAVIARLQAESSSDDVAPVELMALEGADPGAQQGEVAHDGELPGIQGSV